jgi:ATP-binding cassette subfamily B protein
MFYFSRILTGEAFAKELRLFGFTNRFLNGFEELENDLYSEKRRLIRSETKADLVSQLFAVGLLFASLVIVVSLLVSGKLSIGSVVMFFFVFQRGYSVLGDLLRTITRLVEDNVFLNDFIEFLDNPGPDKKSVNHPLTSLKQGIKVENVHFSYKGSRREALAGISLTIPTGKTVAIVGPNGSGKTTLMKLLCGFYQPDAGRILYDDDDLQNLDEQTVRDNITAVFQDFALYNLTAGENIALGDIKRPYQPEKVLTAARNADIAELLEKLPGGYETLLGHLFNSGEDLSIGQWQKIAIARAFYRDAPILFMDEPSSALDAASEKQILDKLRVLGKNRTVVIISHRFSTVQWADCIYVLDKGRLAEVGTHEALLARNGIYSNLYQVNQS